jgi:hypothetical protein
VAAEQDRQTAVAMAVLDDDADPEQMADVRSELEACYAKRPILHAAVELGRRRVEEAEAKARATYAESRRPEYQSLVRKMAVALTTLRSLCVEELRLRQDIDSGVAGGCFGSALTAMPVCGMAVEDIGGELFIWRIDQWLNETREAGYIL